MKCTESRELRDLSMNQLNAKLSELYKELHRSQESSTLNPNKAMKDILVHYTSQERDEDTGLYTDVVYKGYIQHWHCGSGYQMAIILNTEGRFHRTTIDKIWVEKEDMPTTK